MEQQQHPNQTTSPWFPTNQSREQLLAEWDTTGHIISGNYLPYTARLIDIEIDQMGGEYRQVVVPASLEEVHQHWKEMDIFQVDGSEQDSESHEQFARKVAAELWQESWIAGIPETATILCAACQQERPAHGSNLYDHLCLCNRCVEQVEVLMAKQEIPLVEPWVQEMAHWNRLRLEIRQAEQKGQGNVQLPDGSFLDFHPLYEFVRHSEYVQEGEDRSSWPYPDMRPALYHGYVRSNWQPGQYLNTPEKVIIFTSEEKLLHFLETGKLPAIAARERRRLPERKVKNQRKG